MGEETKKTYSFRLNEDVMQRFKSHVLVKYGKLYGVLGEELQNAIASWLGKQGLAAHTRTRINPGIPRTQAKIDGILQYIRNRGFTNQFSVSVFEEAVIDLIGGDKRTIKKYLSLARKLGRVKHYSGAVWEIV